MALDPNYGLRMRENAQVLQPQAFEPAQPLILQQPIDSGMQMPVGGQQAIAQPAQGDGGFPAFVSKSIGAAKPTPEQLESIKQQYLIERFRPREALKKGVNKAGLEALEGAFNSKADRYLTKLLADSSETPDVAGSTADNGASYLRPRVIADTAIGAAKGLTTDLVSGVASLADYGLRKVRTEAVANWRQLMDIADKGIGDNYMGRMDAINKQAARDYGTGPTIVGQIGDAVGKFGDEVGDLLTSDATLKAREGLNTTMEKGGAVDVLKYLGRNPSAAAPMLGETIGAIAPAFFTGGATALIKGGSLATKLSEGGNIAKLAAKAIETAPAIIAGGTAPTGNALVDLRGTINNTSITELTGTPTNKALYESLQTVGLQGTDLDKQFRNILAQRAEDITLAGSAASNMILPLGLGAPAERALLGLSGAGQGFVRHTLGTAGAEAAQEALSAIPDQLSQNAAQSNYTGAPVEATKGLGTNALLSALLGGVVGGGAASIGRGNPLRKQATPAESNATVPVVDTAVAPPTPTSAEAAATNEIPAPIGPDSIVALPGAGLEAKANKAVLKSVETATKAMAARPSFKKSAQALDGAGVLAIAQQMAEDTAGENWAAMSAVQRLDVVDIVAGRINETAKADGVGAVLQAMRNNIQTAPIDAGSVPAAAVPAAPAPAPETALPAPVSADLVVPPAASAAPVAETAPPPAPVAEPAVPAAPSATAESTINYDAKLPDAIAKSAPRYANGSGQYLPQFESDVDKALYVVGQATKSKADGQFRKFLVDNGMPEPSIDAQAIALRTRMRPIMDATAPGTALSPAKVVVSSSGRPQGTQAPPLDKPTRKKNTLKKETTEAPASKTNKLKKDAKPPKAEAPAATAGQVPETAASVVDRVAPDLSKTEKRDLLAGITLAREGNADVLNQGLKTLVSDGVITREQATELRKASKETTPASRGETEQTLAPMEDAVQRDTLEDTIKAVLDTAKGNKSSILLRALSKQSEVTPENKWLANKLAGLTDKINIDLRRMDESVIARKRSEGFLVHGGYQKGRGVVELAPTGFNDQTILHEYLHALTADLLAAKATTQPIVQFQKDIDGLHAHVRKYIRAFPSILADLTPLEVKRLEQPNGPVSSATEMISYGLTNPSFRAIMEKIPAPKGSKLANAWAVFKQYLHNVFSIDPSRISAFDAILENTERLFDYVTETPSVALTASDNRANGLLSTLPSGKSQKFDFNQTYETDFDPMESKIEPAAKSNIDVSPVTMAQRIGEVFAQNAYGIERSVQDTVKAKGKVTNENNPYYASRRYTSDIAENRNTDNLEVAEPVSNWIAANWRKFRSANLDNFRTDLDKFLQNYHALNERNPSIWAETVPLLNGQEITRGSLIDDAYESKLTGKQLQTKLRALADKHAAEPLDKWAAANPSRDPARAREVLVDVAKRGFTPQALTELNGLLQGMRDRTQARMQASGVTSAADPFGDRGWDWYVPLKGSLSTDEAAADYDYGAQRGTSKEFRDRNIKVLKGRTSNSANALEQMLVDMNQAATTEAEGKFKGTAYEYVLDNAKLLGAIVRPFEGTPKQGYTSEGRGKQKGKKVRRATLPNPKYGFVFSDGTTHYEVTLPKGSQLDRGIKGLRNAVSPFDFDESHNFLAAGAKGLGATTNLLARAYTTWSPTWQLAVGFLRDIQGIPLAISAEQFDTPWKARAFVGQYTKNLLGNTFDLASGKQELTALLKNDRGALRKYGEAHPESYVADLLAYRAVGGSTEFSQGLNRESAGDILFDKARRQDGDLLSVSNGKMLYDKFNQLTGDWAALLENKGRVAAWKALQATDPDMTPQAAAAITKGTLDFSQTGEWGKMINIMHAFYRVGATSADTMRRTFSKPNGDPDYKKIANWVPVVSAMGAVSYLMLGAMLGVDDDGKEKIKKIDAKTLTQKFVIPDGDGGLLGIPMQQGPQQMMMSIGVLGAAVTAGNITPKEAAEAYYDVLTRASPLQPTGWKDKSGATGFANSWLIGILAPTVAMPVMESAANVNAFDSPIRTDWPDKNKFASNQGMPSTPEFWKQRASDLREYTGLDMYPETIRHFVKGYGGQQANNILRWTLDFSNKESEGLDSNAVRTAARMGVADDQFYYSREARKATETIAVSKRQYDNAKENGEETTWLSKNPNDAKRIQAGKALTKAQQAYYKKINAIRDNKLLSMQGKKDQRKLADSGLRSAVDTAQKVIEATE